MNWDGSPMLPNHMRTGPRLKFCRWFDDDGLTVRLVRCECDRRDCRTYAGLVSTEQFGDRWFPAYEVEREDWHAGKACDAIQGVLEDPAVRLSAVRAVALLGLPWDRLDYPIVVALMRVVHDGPGWLHDEMACHEPEELRELARWVTDDVVEALRLCRWARRRVDGPVSGVVR